MGQPQGCEVLCLRPRLCLAAQRRSCRDRPHLHHRRHRRRGTDGRDRACPRCGAHAGLHAGRHRRHGEGDVHGPGEGDGRRHHPRQHLSPDAAAGRRAGGGARRPARLLRLVGADPHRLRRLPGDVAGPAEEARRDRRHLPVAYRRGDLHADAGALAGDPGAARFRHPHAARRVHRAARAARRSGARHAPVAQMGGALEGRLRQAGGEGAVRHRPGRRRCRAEGRVGQGAGGHRLRRLRHRRAGGGRAAGRDAEHAGDHGAGAADAARRAI